jgi:G:T-mismatch repair DNA endonuclease (very short patch repair protein)
MPRFVRYPSKKKTAELRQAGSRYRTRGYKNWVDPFPTIEGTLPEKMVYAALSFRGIPFWSQDEVRFSIPEIGFDKDYRPDFVLPTLGIIIEVQGAYFHSKPNVIDADSFKFAIYQQTGWRILAWWDFDIIDNVNKLFLADPQLSQYSALQDWSSETSNGRKVIRNDAAGIQTLNRKRAARLTYRKKTISVGKRSKLKPRDYIANVK